MTGRAPRDPARRSLLRRAVLSGVDPAPLAPPRCVVTGTVVDASPHILSIAADGGHEERLVLTGATVVWRGGTIPPTALRPGHRVVVRRRAGGIADKVWADIGRVCGTIIERSGDTLLVDQGHGRARGVLVLRPGSSGPIMVRFPRLEPGYLVDVIGTRRGGVVEGRVPATSQPPYHGSHVPRAAPHGGHLPDAIGGSASWHEPADGPADERGVAYPALDPDAGCGDGTGACDAVAGCAALPYLSIGSTLLLHNECSGQSGAVQVTGCGAVASRFCDRCLSCGISRRGRVADLTLTTFAELGGELHEGCFNVTFRIGG